MFRNTVRRQREGGRKIERERENDRDIDRRETEREREGKESDIRR